MNPSGHPNHSTNLTSNVPSAPNEQRDGYSTSGYHIVPQQMLQQVPVQRSSPITIPYSNQSNNTAQPSNHPNIDRRGSQEHALVAIPPHGQFPSYGLGTLSRYNVPFPGSMYNNHGSSANSSSGSSRRSSSSDIFHFSPPSSLEGRSTPDSASRAVDTGRFLYTPPPVGMSMQCDTCGDIIHIDERCEHARRCTGRLRSPGSGTAVLWRRGHTSNGYQSDNSQQGSWARSSSSQHAYAHGAGNAIASTSHGYAYSANEAQTPRSQGGEMVPRAYYQADHATPRSPPPPYS